MPSVSFVKQKAIGRWFEGLIDPEIVAMGARVIDTDRWGYRFKRGIDRHIRMKDGSANVEYKLDLWSNRTKKVCVDLESLRKSDSSIWLFGLPEGEEIEIEHQGVRFMCGKWIKVHSMYHSKLAPFVHQYIKDNPLCLKELGEFKQKNPLIPKSVFLSQPFMGFFKTIEARQIE